MLLTGRHGRRYGFGNNLVFDSAGAMPSSELTIADIVASAPFDYTSAVFGKWHLAGRDAPEVTRRPELHGFDHYDVTAGNIEDELVDDGTPNDYFHWERLEGGVQRHVDGYNPSVTIDATLDWIEATPEPWLAYVAMHSAHGPNHVPPGDLQATGVTEASSDPDLFGAMVEAGDAELGRLLANLPEGVSERTTIIVAGDNGTKLINIRPPWDIPGSKSTFYDAGLRVPMVMSGPLVQRPGAVTEALVHFVDLLPTIADIACVDADNLVRTDGTPVPVDGRSLAAQLSDPDDLGPRDYVYTEQFGGPGPPPHNAVDKRAIITHDHKLVVDVVRGTETLTELHPSPELESDDLLVDPDLDGFTATVADALRATLDAHHAGLTYVAPAEEP